MMRKLILLSFLTFFIVHNAWGACGGSYTESPVGTFTAYDSSRDCVQAAVDAASGTNKVAIPTGNPTWSTSVTVPNKNLEIYGPNCTVDTKGRPTSCPLTINVTGIGGCGDDWAAGAFCFRISSVNPATTQTSVGTNIKAVSFKMHDIAFTGTPTSDNFITVSGYANNPTDIPSYGFRFYRLFFNLGDQVGVSRVFHVTGPAWGLIDHINSVGYGHIFLYVDGLVNHEYYDAANVGIFPMQSLEGSFSWSLPLHLGSEEAVYVEDSYLEWTSTGNNRSITDVANGGGFVVRHNDVKRGMSAWHTGGYQLGRGTKKFELYANTWLSPGATNYPPFYGQGTGTGVIFNNIIAADNGGHGLRMSLDRQYTGGWSSYYYGTCRMGENGDSTGCVSSGNPVPCCTGAGTGTCAWGGGTPAGHTWDGFTEKTGWPCLDQMGRGCPNGCPLGTAQQTVPVLIYHNGPEAGCLTKGGTCTDNDSAISVDVGIGSYADNATPVDSYVKTTTHGLGGDKDYCNMDPTDVTSGNKCGNYGTTYTALVHPHPLNTDAPPPDDTTPPIITAFTIPGTNTGFAVPISSFTATDDTGVTGYLINESSSTPSTGDAGWGGTAQTIYTVTRPGAHTLYAWAKDAAGNVSSGSSASVTVSARAPFRKGF